jgi:predicted  nucleic acid-binding Zn-ribbon protein
MAMFLNFYICENCDSTWTDLWSAMCDDDCPHCGARHMSPFKSEDADDDEDNDDDSDEAKSDRT